VSFYGDVLLKQTSMHGEASPYGRGGGAMHIALGVRSTIFPIDRFLNARGRTSVTIATAAQLGNHEPATLTFSSNLSRRGGEWLIRDQYSHRHPAWSSAAGFPSRYDKTDPPYVLIFRVDTTFLCGSLGPVNYQNCPVGQSPLES